MFLYLYLCCDSCSVRCQASCIAVTCAIAFMLSRDAKYYRGNDCNGKAVREAAFQEAKLCFSGCEQEEVMIFDMIHIGIE